MQTSIQTIIETYDNQLWRVVSAFDADAFNCIPVKKAKDGFADKAKARLSIIRRERIFRVLEGVSA